MPGIRKNLESFDSLPTRKPKNNEPSYYCLFDENLFGYAPDLQSTEPESDTDSSDEPSPSSSSSVSLCDTASEDTFILPVSKNQRKLIIDKVTNLSVAQIKEQMKDTSDIVSELDLAPPKKKHMHWKNTGGVEELFALPTQGTSSSKALQKVFQRGLVSRSTSSEKSNGPMLGNRGKESEETNGFTGFEKCHILEAKINLNEALSNPARLLRRPVRRARFNFAAKGREESAAPA